MLFLGKKPKHGAPETSLHGESVVTIMTFRDYSLCRIRRAHPDLLKGYPSPDSTKS